jgi:2-keto-4-pentenoate hydratase
VQPATPLDGIAASVRINGGAPVTGVTDDPLGALAWVANLAASRGRPLKAGQVIITGSVVPTFTAKPGDDVSFQLAGFGEAKMSVA